MRNSSPGLSGDRKRKMRWDRHVKVDLPALRAHIRYHGKLRPIPSGRESTERHFRLNVDQVYFALVAFQQERASVELVVSGIGKKL